MKRFLSIIILLLSLNVMAFESKKLDQNISKFLNSSTDSFIKLERTSPQFSLAKVRTRARLYFGVEIPFITKAEIRPEIELFWVKK